MTVRVTLRRLFAGQLLGGHSPVEFERMTSADRAAVLAALPYSPANDMPANIHAEARKLNTAARNTLALLEDGRDISRAVSCALAVGTAVQRIESILATAAALDVTEQLQRPRSAGGKETARQRKEKAASNQEVAAAHWRKLADEGRPEHERTGIIAQRMNAKGDTVRRWIRKAGLR